MTAEDSWEDRPGHLYDDAAEAESTEARWEAENHARLKREAKAARVRNSGMFFLQRRRRKVALKFRRKKGVRMGPVSF